MRYVDIHCHVLPGMDDGSRDMEMTLGMLKMYEAENVEHIIATPHHRMGYSSYDKDIFRERLIEVRNLIADEGIDIQLHRGQELYFDYSNLKDVIEGNAYTMADGRYVLFELPNYVNMDTLYEYLYEFELKDYRMILAHVERYEIFREKPNLLLELHHKGVLFQVNSRSVNIGRDKKTSKWVDQLLQKGYVHFISTDAHSTGRRKPTMEESYRYIHKLIGDKADDIYRNNGLKIIRNEEIFTDEPTEFKKVFGNWR